jgi:hypothetical protein
MSEVASLVDPERTSIRRPGKRVGEPIPTIFMLASVAKYSSEIQQPVRATAALGKHPRTHQAAPPNPDQVAPIVCIQMLSVARGMDGYHRAMRVPERAANRGHQRSLTGTPNGIRAGHVQVTRCVWLPLALTPKVVSGC